MTPVLVLPALLLLLAQPPNCDQAKAEWARHKAASQQKSQLAKRAAALTYARKFPVDPEGCFLPDVRSYVAKAEVALVRWTAKTDWNFPPQRILLCGFVDAKTQHCTGPDLDDTILSRDGEAKVPPLPASIRGLRLWNDAGLGWQLLGVYTGVVSQLQDGKPPVRLQIAADRTLVSNINPESVIIAIFRTKDGPEFPYRKVIWRTTPAAHTQ